MILLELARDKGLVCKRVASTNGGEYESSCPACAGKDRFRIWPSTIQKNCQGRYWCRNPECKKEGDSIQFCIDFLGMSFQEAVTRLGVTLPEKRIRKLKIKSEPVPALINAPSATWGKCALAFVEWASAQIVENPEVLAYLETRGISLETVVRYKLGWCPQDLNRSRAVWGLEEILKDNGCIATLWLPKGIVIPTIEPSGKVSRIKIRRDYAVDGKKYIIVPGRQNGLNIVGNKSNKMLIVVEAELDAYAILQAVGDIAFVIAVGSCALNPDNVSDYYAKNIQHLFICHDNDDAGKKMFEKWKKLYPHAKAYPTPIGKDIGEAVQNGLALRAWLLKAVPEDIIKKPDNLDAITDQQSMFKNNSWRSGGDRG